MTRTLAGALVLAALAGCGNADEPAANPSSTTDTTDTTDPTDPPSTTAEPSTPSPPTPSPKPRRTVDGLTIERTADARFATQFVTLAAGDAWLPNPDDNQVTRLDGETGRVVAEIAVGDPDAYGLTPDPHSVTTDPDGQVWAGAFSTDSAVRIDPAKNKVVESVSVGVDPYGLAVTETDIWVTSFEQSLVIRVDRASGERVARIRVPSPTAILKANGAIWVAGHRDGRVSRIDPATNKVTGAADASPTLEGMIFHQGALWVASNTGQAVERIDPDTLKVTSIPLPYNGYGLAAGPDGIWVTAGAQEGCDETNSVVILIDPARRVELARRPVDCAFAVAALPRGLVIVQSDTMIDRRNVSIRWRG